MTLFKLPALMPSRTSVKQLLSGCFVIGMTLITLL